jgi:hypothetical protein
MTESPLVPVSIRVRLDIAHMVIDWGLRDVLKPRKDLQLSSVGDTMGESPDVPHTFR